MQRRFLVLAMAMVVTTVGATTGAAGAADTARDRKPVKAKTAAQLAAAMADRGLGCDPFVDADDSQASTVPGGPPKGDTGECPVNGANASISVYATRRELARALDAMPVLCRFAVAVLGPVRFTFVTGKNWSVSTFTEEYDPAIAEELGAKERVVDCTALAKG